MANARHAALAIVILLCVALPVVGQESARPGGIGGLLVAPTRIVLGPRERVAELTLINRGEQTLIYRLALVNKKMTEQGALEDVSPEEAGPFSAARLVVYAPRQVVMGPGEEQKVRFLVRRPADLQPGEYRSHLLIQAEASAASTAGAEAPTDSKEPRARIGVRANPAISIPVIVRHGVGSAKVSLTDLALLPSDPGGGGSAVSFRLNREGSQSTYGDVTVTYLPAGEREGQTVGVLRGVAVYTPNATRLVKVAIAESSRLQPGGRLRVSYGSPGEGKGDAMADGEITLP
jgi:hypothetical protein